jgi:hypothetical protein
MIWRVWHDKGTPLNELRYEWTYPDLLKANAILDMYGAMDTARNALDERDLKGAGK